MSEGGFTLNQLFGVEGKHVLITGGGTGIGFYIAKGFVANGATVHIVGRREAVLLSAKAQLDTLHPEADVRIIVADITDPASISRLAASLTRLDVLINNAGIVLPDAPSSHLTPLPQLQAALLSSPPDAWARTFHLNVWAPYHLAASLLHLLAASASASTSDSESGRIINVSSIGARMSDPHTHQPAYQASKAALDHLTRVLASKLRNTGVTVNAIAPGYFPSEMNDPSNPGSGVAGAEGSVPLSRAGREEDVAGTALWMSSRAGAYLHGCVVPLGGGREWA